MRIIATNLFLFQSAFQEVIIVFLANVQSSTSSIVFDAFLSFIKYILSLIGVGTNDFVTSCHVFFIAMITFVHCSVF